MSRLLRWSAPLACVLALSAVAATCTFSLRETRSESLDWTPAEVPAG